MIASPIENVSRITGILIIGIIVGATVIIILLSVLSLKDRKKEIGILLSMGENKLKITIQILIEGFTPILIASVIGLFVGITIGSTYIKNLSDDVYMQKAEELMQENEQVLYSYMQEDSYATDLGWNHSGFADLVFKEPSRITIQTNVDPKINSVTIINYIAITFGLVFVILIIQISFILKFKPIFLLNNKK